MLVAAGCGGEKTVQPLPETVEGTIEQATLPEGDAAAGGTVFASAGCGSCHTYSKAKSNGKVGPDLDKALQSRGAEFIRTSIVSPNAEIAAGFNPGIMPQTYGGQLSDQQLSDLVAFLLPSG